MCMYTISIFTLSWWGKPKERHLFVTLLPPGSSLGKLLSCGDLLKVWLPWDSLPCYMLDQATCWFVGGTCSEGGELIYTLVAKNYSGLHNSCLEHTASRR